MRRLDTTMMLAALAAACLSCSVTRSVRPVGRRQLAVAASVGGPLFTNLGPPLPAVVPVTSVRYGLTDTLDVDAGLLWPITPLAGLDVGLSTLVWPQRRGRPALMAGGRVTTVMALAGSPATRVLPEMHATTSWQLGEQLLAYTGFDLMLATRTPRVHPSVWVGLVGPTPWRGLTFSVEGRWLAMSTETRYLSVRYANLAGHGAFAAAMGVAYQFQLPNHHVAH